MAITIRRRIFGTGHWGVDGDNIVFPNLISRGLRKFFALNPTVIDSLGDKDSILTTPQINENLIYTTSSDLSVLAVDYADTNWTAKGWDITSADSIHLQLETFLANNFNQQGINTNLTDMVVIITKGSIGGTDYTIPFAYYGVVGEIVEEPAADEFTQLLIHFDEIVQDSSTNQLAITLDVAGELTFEAGKFNQAMYFNDLGDQYFHVDHNGELDLGSGDFTIELQVKFNAVPPQAVLLDAFVAPFAESGPFSETYRGWQLTYGEAGPNPRVIIYYPPGLGGYPLFADLPGSIADGQFHHIAFIRDGNVLNIYVDGINRKTQVISGSFDDFPNLPLYVGVNRETPSENPMYGNIDEIRISNTVRWSSDFTPPAAPYVPVEYFPPPPDAATSLLLHLDSGIDDSSTNEFVGTVTGSMNLVTAKFDSGLSISPGNNVVFNDDVALDIGGGDFTIECWFQHGAGAGTDNFYLLTKTNNSQNTGWALLVMTNRIRFLCFDTNNVVHVMDSAADGSLITALQADFCHIAAVRSGSDYFLFFNGVQVATMNFALNMIDTADLVGIGRRHGNSTVSAITGIIDEVRISKGVARWTSDFSGSLPNAPY